MGAERFKLNGLQAGRGIAAMLVVLHHAANHLKADFGYLPLWGFFHFGRAGVDFFFVLSGFIIFFVHSKDIGNPARLGSYFVKRFTRIFPIYWIVILILLGISLVTHKTPSPKAFLMDAFLLPMAELNTLGVAWTLRFELFFYGMFAIAIMSRSIGAIMLAFWVLGIALQALGFMPPISPEWVNMVFSPWNIEFMLGMLAAYYLLQNKVRSPKALFWISLLAFLAFGVLENLYLLDGTAGIARLFYGLSSMLMLMGLVEWERVEHFITPRPLVIIGEASYSVYLIHLLSIGVAYKILDVFGVLSRIPLDVTYALLFVAAVVGGVATSRLLELPLIRLVRKLLAKINYHPVK
ncbi:MAG: acyltransferase [Methylococcales bacterium]|nr:acyltransferase [Methylococcales bacterium]